jgi:phosphohistidine phosphatase SixA
MLLVRHASAGDRDLWVGHDHERPLDARGWRQAGALVGRLERFPLEAIWTSPYRRCIETVLPIAAARGLEPLLREELTEELHLADGIEFVQAHAGEPVLICGHGGLEFALATPRKWRKGATFVVDGALRIVEELKPST